VKTVLREPLLHFLALGALRFAWFEWKGGASGPGTNRIVVTPGQVEHLVSGYTRTFGRPPAEAELEGLIDDYVKEEIATREATAMGLDRDDTVIRRRLRQKLEFLAEEAVGTATPTDAEIQAWVDAHPESFGGDVRLSFRQVYIKKAGKGPAVKGEAEKLLAQLRAAGPETNTQTLGDSTMLPAEISLLPLFEVGRTFGDGFAKKLLTIEPGTWSGPIESSYGLHIVLVRERTEAEKPSLTLVRPLVERELAAERGRRELEKLYERLLTRYTVTIEMPKAVPDSGEGKAEGRP